MTSLRGVVRVSSPGAPPVRATAPDGGRVLVAPGVQGPPGHGVNLAGAVATYADLPALTASDAGKAFMVQDDGRLYVWSGVSWPADGAGAQFRGEVGPEGRGIEVVSVDGDDLVLGMTDGSTVRASVPALAAAVAAADSAQGSATAAAADAGRAEAAADDVAQVVSDAAGVLAGEIADDLAASQAARTGAESARDQAVGAAGDASMSAAQAATSAADAEVSAQGAGGSSADASARAGEAAASATSASESAQSAHAAKAEAATIARDEATTVATSVARAEVATIIGSAPEHLDTLEELATFASGNASSISALNSQMAGKVNGNYTIVVSSTAPPGGTPNNQITFII